MKDSTKHAAKKVTKNAVVQIKNGTLRLFLRAISALVFVGVSLFIYFTVDAQFFDKKLGTSYSTFIAIAGLIAHYLITEPILERKFSSNKEDEKLTHSNHEEH